MSKIKLNIFNSCSENSISSRLKTMKPNPWFNVDTPE